MRRVSDYLHQIHRNSTVNYEELIQKQSQVTKKLAEAVENMSAVSEQSEFSLTINVNKFANAENGT